MSLRPMDSEYKRHMSPSLSLLTLAALTPSQHTVCIADENSKPLRMHPVTDLVGITVTVDTAYRAYDIADAYRQLGIPVILGGIHASACPDEAEQHADSVCIGEAEPVWIEILTDCQNKKLKKRYAASRPVDPATIPIPRWEAIDQSAYLYTNIICASRGCPFRCEFCYNSCSYVHPGHRARPVAQVVAEIERLPTRHVMFIDDNFIGNPAWTKELLQAIEPLGLKWNAAVSANIGKYPELLDRMAATGCQSLFIGFETINEQALTRANKHQNRVASYEQTITAIHDRHIMINASLVFGFDTDTPETFPATLDWLVRNRIETMTAHILTPYPGTKLYQRYIKENRIIDKNWSQYNTAHVVFKPHQLTAAELYTGYLWMYDQFYSWKNIWKRLPLAPRQRMPYLLFNLGYRKFGKLTSMLANHGCMHALGRLARRLAYGIE